MHQREPRFNPRLIDALVVAGVALPGAVGMALLVAVVDAPVQRVGLLAPALLAAQAGVLWWRRRRPLSVLVATLVALLAARALGDPNAASFLGPYAAAYAAAVYGTRRSAMAGLAAMTIAAALDWGIASIQPAGEPFNALLLSPAAAALVIAWGIGRYVRVRRDYLDTLVAYAHQLEKDRDEQARQAVLEERRRIARELHDQVAHDLGVAVLQTGAARTWLERDAARASAAMTSAENAMRVALTTMPVILEALRADDNTADLAPQPTLADLDDLLGRVSSAGLAVDVQIEGERRPLDPAVELTAYRIVQEALTNTLKHAGANASTVRLRFGADQLDIDVADDGASDAAAAGAPGAGLGLVGMRERVDLLGGALQTGPADDGGGFRVRATLPLRSPEARA